MYRLKWSRWNPLATASRSSPEWELFFFFCVPSRARSSVRWVRQSPRSAAVSQPVPKTSRGHPQEWAMCGVSKRRMWGRIAGCGWGFEDLSRIDIRLNGKFLVWMRIICSVTIEHIECHSRDALHILLHLWYALSVAFEVSFLPKVPMIQKMLELYKAWTRK